MLDIMRLVLWLNEKDPTYSYSFTVSIKNYYTVHVINKKQLTVHETYYSSDGTNAELLLQKRVTQIETNTCNDIEMVTVTIPLETAKELKFV